MQGGDFDAVLLGNEFDERYAVKNLDESGNDDYCAPVGTRLPNAWGLYDMISNVPEICWDWYSREYYNTEAKINPRGPSGPSGDIELKVVRSGNRFQNDEKLSCASRMYMPTRFAEMSVGIRVVLPAR